MINKKINEFINYAITKSLISTWEVSYVYNELKNILHIDDFDFIYLPEVVNKVDINYFISILIKKGIIENNLYHINTFKSIILNLITPRMDLIIKNAYLENNPLDYLYNISLNSMYINPALKKEVDGLIYCSYKDYTDIYVLDRCRSCLYIKNHLEINFRFLPLKLKGEDYFISSSKPQFMEKEIFINSIEHKKDVFNITTFEKMVCFVDMYNNYYIGKCYNNSHEDYYAGLTMLPIEKAYKKFIKKINEVSIYTLDYFIPVLVLESLNVVNLQKLVFKVKSMTKFNILLKKEDTNYIAYLSIEDKISLLDSLGILVNVTLDELKLSNPSLESIINKL